MPLPSALSFLGIGKEVTKWTGVVPTAFIPYKPGSLKMRDKILQLDDDGMRGSLVDIYDTTTGPQFCEVEWSGPVFADTLGWLLAGLMGDVVTTGASAPFTHAIGLKNSGDGQPTTYSLTDFYGIAGTNSRRVAGFQVSEVGLKFSSEGILEYSVKGLGLATALVAKPTASFGAESIKPSFIGTTTIGGASVLYLESGSLTMKRPVTPVHSIDGTPAPYKIWVGSVSVEGSITVVHEDDTELTRYLTNSKPSLVLDWLQSAPSPTTEVKVTMTKCGYRTGEIDRGKDYVESTYAIKGIANTTDVGASGGFSPCKWTIQNALPAATYV